MTNYRPVPLLEHVVFRVGGRWGCRVGPRWRRAPLPAAPPAAASPPCRSLPCARACSACPNFSRAPAAPPTRPQGKVYAKLPKQEWVEGEEPWAPLRDLPPSDRRDPDRLVGAGAAACSRLPRSPRLALFGLPLRCLAALPPQPRPTEASPAPAPVSAGRPRRSLTSGPHPRAAARCRCWRRWHARDTARWCSAWAARAARPARAWWPTCCHRCVCVGGCARARERACVRTCMSWWFGGGARASDGRTGLVGGGSKKAQAQESTARTHVQHQQAATPSHCACSGLRVAPSNTSQVSLPSPPPPTHTPPPPPPIHPPPPTPHAAGPRA